MKNFVEIVFILDRSGSMQGLEKDTIGGFNALLAKQGKGEGRALVSTVLFDDTAEVLRPGAAGAGAPDDRKRILCSRLYGAARCHGRSNPSYQQYP